MFTLSGHSTKSQSTIENLNSHSIINVLNKPKGYSLTNTIVAPNHAYAALYVGDAKGRLQMRNPPGLVNAVITGDGSGTITFEYGNYKDGEVHMNFAAFKQYFGTYHISKTKSKKT